MAHSAAIYFLASARALHDAWEACLNDLLAYSTVHMETATEIKEKVCAPIFKLSSEELSKQVRSAGPFV